MNVNAVTWADLVRVARQYINLGHLNIMVVGDQQVVGGSLAATGIALIVRLDGDGHPAVTTGERPRRHRQDGTPMPAGLEQLRQAIAGICEIDPETGYGPWPAF